MFPRNTYINRRGQLKKLMGSGIILLTGNEEVGMNYFANVYPFRQDSTFLYYFGLDTPGLCAIIDIDNDDEIIYGDEPTTDEIVWTGPQELLTERSDRCGVKKVSPTTELAAFIKQAMNADRQIHYLHPYRYRNLYLLSTYFNKKPKNITKKASLDLTKAVVAQRSIKDPDEIKEIEKAVEITAWMHRKAMEFAIPGMREVEIAAELNKIAMESGAGISFPSIVTVKGEVLHNQFYDNILRNGQMLLVDAGAESKMHYAGDMSRTFPVSKEFTEIQKQIYQIALDAQLASIAKLKPDVKYLDVHLTAAKTIAEGLKSMGLMKGDVDEAVEMGAHALFFQCGTGHMMGLDVHDMENLGEEYVGYDEKTKKAQQFGLNYLRLGKELKPGFVVTVEPGIYFIPTLIDLWRSEKKFSQFINYDEVDKFRNFGGLRSEDDFVITKTGYRKLGPRVPKEIKDLEDIRKSALS